MKDFLQEMDIFPVLLNPIHVVCTSARKANYLPCRHIFIVAMRRITKVTLMRILQQLRKEDLDRNLVDIECALSSSAKRFTQFLCAAAVKPTRPLQYDSRGFMY